MAEPAQPLHLTAAANSALGHQGFTGRRGGPPRLRYRPAAAVAPGVPQDAAGRPDATQGTPATAKRCSIVARFAGLGRRPPGPANKTPADLPGFYRRASGAGPGMGVLARTPGRLPHVRPAPWRPTVLGAAGGVREPRGPVRGRAGRRAGVSGDHFAQGALFYSWIEERPLRES
jgi:hypothetical protein